MVLAGVKRQVEEQVAGVKEEMRRHVGELKELVECLQRPQVSANPRQSRGSRSNPSEVTL